MIRIIFGILILAFGSYVFYLGISGLLSGTEGSRNSAIGRGAIAVLGAGIASIGIALIFSW
jgi:hypothetical protein